MEQEKRAFDFKNLEIRKNPDGSKSLEGYASVFDEVIDIMNFREVIRPGAFAAALKRSDLDVEALINHNSERLIGRYRADKENNTLELKEDSKGLWFRIKPLPDTQEVKDLLEHMRLGNIDSCSFAFTVKSENWEEEADGVNLREIKEVDELLDISIVNRPAYPGTSVKVAERAKNRAKNYKLDLMKKKLQVEKLRF